MPPNRLKELRLEEGLTQEQVVQRLARQGIKITTSSLSRWENNLFPIPDQRKADLARFYGVSVPRLLRLDEESGS